jgi:hypothetical protein
MARRAKQVREHRHSQRRAVPSLRNAPTDGVRTKTKTEERQSESRSNTRAQADVGTVYRRLVPHPIFRKLRVFAIDPGMTARFETAVLNEMTLAIPWEELEPGPIGEYVAVVDEDESGVRLHEPVDLNDLHILAQDGLAPSDGNPQFRQQMVYAVAMRTIRNFERALGRVIHWPVRFSDNNSERMAIARPLTKKDSGCTRITCARPTPTTVPSGMAFVSVTSRAIRSRPHRERRFSRAFRRTSSRTI